MADLNDFFRTNLVDDHVAGDVNDLIAASLRSEYKNVETLSADKTLTDADTPIQRLNCNGANRIVKMPTADAVENHPFFIVNSTASGAYTLTVQNNGATINHAVLMPSEYILMLPDGNGTYQTLGRPFGRILTPAQITSNQNDYNPSGAGSADVIRLSSDASRNVTGLAFLSGGKAVLLLNVGSNDIVLKDESASSAAANRFALNADMTLSADQAVLAWYDPTSARVRVIGGGAAAGDKYPMEARLTLETGVPISTTDQTAKTTLYLTPYKGNQIAVYDGTSAWSTLTLSADISITLAGLTAGLPYDVYVYSNAGTLALELTAWTNTTTRATARALQNGVYVKTGATTRRFVGTICIVATGQCEDSVSKRMVNNFYNQVPRPMAVSYISSHAYATAAWRAWNNNAALSQVSMVLCDAQQAIGTYRTNITVAGGGGVAFGTATTGPGGSKGEQFNNVADVGSADVFLLAAGYNIFVAVEYGSLTTERISTTMSVWG